MLRYGCTETIISPTYPNTISQYREPVQIWILPLIELSTLSNQAEKMPINADIYIIVLFKYFIYLKKSVLEHLAWMNSIYWTIFIRLQIYEKLLFSLVWFIFRCLLQSHAVIIAVHATGFPKHSQATNLKLLLFIYIYLIDLQNYVGKSVIKTRFPFTCFIYKTFIYKWDSSKTKESSFS